MLEQFKGYKKVKTRTKAKVWPWETNEEGEQHVESIEENCMLRCWNGKHMIIWYRETDYSSWR